MRLVPARIDTVFKMFKTEGASLHDAAVQGDCNAIRQLLNRNANVNAVDEARGCALLAGFGAWAGLCCARSPGRTARAPSSTAGAALGAHYVPYF